MAGEPHARRPKLVLAGPARAAVVLELERSNRLGFERAGTSSSGSSSWRTAGRVVVRIELVTHRGRVRLPARVYRTCVKRPGRG